MSYQVLSRKWRPQVFEDLIGQDHVARTLQNALQRERVAHAYMFTGARGVGKTSTARILAKTLNCPNVRDAKPCNECPVCREITRGNSLDVLEIDGASNRGIDEIRELREAVKYPPTTGNYRIYIIDEVHMLTTQAFNALLKTLEEPPEHVKFILATTDPQKVPQTILSRTQRFDFRRIPTPDIAAFLAHILDAEKIAYDESALLILARKADGSIRDGLSLLDQIIAYQDEKVDEEAVVSVLGLVEDAFYADLLDHIARHDRPGVLALVEAMFDGGYDLQEVCQGLDQFLRDAILTLETGDAKLTSKGALVDLPEGLTTADLMNLLDIGLETEGRLRYAQQPRILMEQQLLKMAEFDRVVSIQELLSSLAAGTGPASPSDTNPSRQPGPGSTAPRESAAQKGTPAGETAHQVSSAPTPQKRTFNRREPTAQATRAPEESGSDSPEPTPQGLPPDALDQVQHSWAEIVGAVATKSQAVGAMLSDSEVSGLEGVRLTVHLPASQSIHLSMLMDKRRVIEDTIQEIMGWKLLILPTIPETPSQKPHSKGTASSGNDAFDELVETFKGEEY